MKKYQVEITNGKRNQFIEVDQENEKSAILKVESKINSTWTVIDIKEIKEEILITSKNVYAVYSKDHDITSIFEDTFKNEQLVSTEVVGYYFGQPNPEATIQFNGKRKAEFITEGEF